MRKYMLYLHFIINTFIFTSLFACPHEFCPEDERPFFEQYEIINIATSLKKGK